MEECLIEDSHQQKKTDIIHGFKFFNEYLLCVNFPSLLLLLAFSSFIVMSLQKGSTAVVTLKVILFWPRCTDYIPQMTRISLKQLILK